MCFPNHVHSKSKYRLLRIRWRPLVTIMFACEWGVRKLWCDSAVQQQQQRQQQQQQHAKIKQTTQNYPETLDSLLVSENRLCELLLEEMIQFEQYCFESLVAPTSKSRSCALTEAIVDGKTLLNGCFNWTEEVTEHKNCWDRLRESIFLGKEESTEGMNAFFHNQSFPPTKMVYSKGVNL